MSMPRTWCASSACVSSTIVSVAATSASGMHTKHAITCGADTSWLSSRTRSSFEANAPMRAYRRARFGMVCVYLVFCALKAPLSRCMRRKRSATQICACVDANNVCQHNALRRV